MGTARERVACGVERGDVCAPARGTQVHHRHRVFAGVVLLLDGSEEGVPLVPVAQDRDNENLHVHDFRESVTYPLLREDDVSVPVPVPL